MSISFTVRRNGPPQERSYGAVLRSLEKKETSFVEMMPGVFRSLNTAQR